MMTSQILKSVDFVKTQKSRYLESKTFRFSSKEKIHYLRIKGYFMAKKSFAAEVNFKYFESSDAIVVKKKYKILLCLMKF